MSTYKIDWVQELARLQPHLAGRGGIVRIRHHGEASAWSKFSELLKERHAIGNPPSFSIRLDPQDFNVRMLADALHEFERKLAKAGAPVAPVERGGMSFLSGNLTGGNATNIISNSIIGDGQGDGQNELPKLRDARIAAVVAALDAFLAVGRCMIVIHPQPAETENFFWRHFWMDGLDALVAKGLVLIHFHDEECGRPHRDAPDPTLLLTLPRDLTDEARAGDAYDDLHKIFTDKGMSGDAATEAAMNVLTLGNAPTSVAAVHDNLGTRLLRLEQEAAQ